MDIFERIVEIRRRGQRAALVTVTATEGSAPRRAGARMLVLADGSIEGTVGGGRVEHVVREAAARVIGANHPESISYRLSADLDMGCGGAMTLFVEPLAARPPLIIFGCGHVGAALARTAAPLGFEIVAVDELAEYGNRERLPDASRIINSFDAAALGDLPFGDESAVVIVTRQHKMDQAMLDICADKPLRYLGVIGSPRKAALQREQLTARGLDPALVNRVRCPVGLDIGAETPDEIAVAICAELIEVYRGGAKFTPR